MASSIPVGASCFENICSKCHLPSLTNWDVGFYCYTCKAIILTQTQAKIACKIKQENNQVFDYVLCDLWIKALLDHDLVTLEDLKKMKRFFLQLFCDKKPRGKFILNPTIQFIGFSTLKKTMNRDAKSTCGKEGTNHGKFKEIEI